MLGGRRIEGVVLETANESQNGVSAAADSRENARGGVLELLEGRVLLEALGEILGGLRVQSVVAEAVSTGRIGVSAAADGRIQGGGQRT